MTLLEPEKIIRTTCPYCGVGCQMDLNIKDGRIYRVEAPFDSAPNYGNLCVKGRFGLDFATHPRRLKQPLIRDGARGNFREASWDEALEYVSRKLSALVTEHGGDCVATYACAKATNEDNYVLSEVGARGDEDQQRRSLRAALPRRQRHRLAAGDWFERHEQQHRRDGKPRYLHRHRQQYHRDPSGHQLVPEKGGAAKWRQANRHRSATD